jgi:hypothetical protein
MQVSVQFPWISVTILEVLYVVYIIITSELFWINMKNKSADASIIFECLQKLCYTQNLI